MLLNFKESTLSNGIRVATSRMDSVESVAMGVWVGVGGRYEDKKLSGISHFIEHLLFKGTESRSARDISQAIEGRGGYFNAFTQEESTCYYSRIAAEHTWSTFDILSDMYLHPRFASEDIEKERGVIIEEIMMYRDQPQHRVQEMLGESLWANHPLGRPLIGTVENIQRVSREEILGFKSKKYVPANTIVVFAGKVDHDECVKRVSDILSGVRKSAKPTYKTVDNKCAQEKVAVGSKDIEQTHIAMGVRLFGRHDARKYPLKVLSIVLGENMSSRLFQIVREKHGLAYSIHSSVELYDETGVLSISAGVDRKRSDKAFDLIVRELNQLKLKKVGASELRRAKDYAIGQLRIGLESTTNQMMWVGENMMNFGRFIQPDEVIQSIEKVTDKDISKVANEILDADRLSVAMVTPNGETGHEEHLLSGSKQL
jgi:predicted Zn-dependent peptidase